MDWGWPGRGPRGDLGLSGGAGGHNLQDLGESRELREGWGGRGEAQQEPRGAVGPSPGGPDTREAHLEPVL